MADRFPLYLPFDARRLFQSESLLRRFAQMAQWDRNSNLLELHASLGGLALVRALGGSLTIVESEQRLLDQVRERARIAGVASQVTFTVGDTLTLDYPPQSFNGIFSFGRVLGTAGDLARRLRPLVAAQGRVGFACVVKVGRSPADAAVGYWATRLGAPPPLPRDALLDVEAAGFEPELLETIGDSELDEYYKDLEGALARTQAPADEGPTRLREEIAVHRALQGRTGVTQAFVVARRKEPGEKPPLSRDSG